MLPALVTIMVATGLLYWLRPALDKSIVALLYLLPVGLCAALWGLTAGLAAACGAFFVFNYFFIEPYGSLSVHHPQDILVLLVFLGVAGAIGQLVGRARAGQAEANAREHEATQLYELSLRLRTLADETAIARALAEHLRIVFRAVAVEIWLQGDARQSPTVVAAPEGPEVSLAVAPAYVVPLLAARGLLGEIRLWREAPFDRSTEERLLQLFAHQGAQALEYAALARTATRAQVLEESDRLKSALLDSVSHELRTPLAAIKAAATSLRDGEVDWEAPVRAELLTVMEEEVDQLNRLVGNLLDMSRIEAGALNLQRQWNSLAEIVASAAARLRRAAARHRLDLDVSDDLPLAPVDAGLIQQVFTNLLSNSLKYAPPGTTVSVTAQPTEAALTVQVRNQGPAVPEEHLEHIFDKFYRVTAADRVTGTGLGLSICKGIVEAHGGRIWAQNLPDGFAFHFTLPLSWAGHPRPQLPPEVDD